VTPAWEEVDAERQGGRGRGEVGEQGRVVWEMEVGRGVAERSMIMRCVTLRFESWILFTTTPLYYTLFAHASNIYSLLG
jgi:hypothetical protein